MEFEGNCIVVTGGGSGLGAATAELLRARGATVVRFDKQYPEGGDGSAPEYPAVVADICDESSLNEAFDVAERSGPIRGIVHCAGRAGDRVRVLNRRGDAGDVASFRQVLEINLVGTYNVLRLGAKRMQANEPDQDERGAIVLTASVAAFDGQVGQAAYSASKAGVHGMTLSAARDLAEFGIRLNTIAPGLFDTPMLARLREDIRDGLAASVPFPNRLGRPEDYAGLAAALLENSYMNGETVRLDGAIRMAPR